MIKQGQQDKSVKYWKQQKILKYSKTPLSRQHWDNSKSGGLANLAA